MAEAAWWVGVAALVVFVNIPQPVIVAKIEGFRLLIPEIKDILGIE